MTGSELARWEKGFRAAARRDRSAVFRDHLRRLGLPDQPELMLEGTIGMLRQLVGYAEIDGFSDKFRELLAMQTYDPRKAEGARYVFTFNVCGKAFPRVLVHSKYQTLDLADLYNSPWWEHKVSGFRTIWISHPDWSEITREEAEQLEDEVTNDLRFDYCEEELEVWFDGGCLDSGYLIVHLLDVHEEPLDDDDESE